MTRDTSKKEKKQAHETSSVRCARRRLDSGHRRPYSPPLLAGEAPPRSPPPVPLHQDACPRTHVQPRETLAPASVSVAGLVPAPPRLGLHSPIACASSTISRAPALLHRHRRPPPGSPRDRVDLAIRWRGKRSLKCGR
jgi:hypothetical protein